MRKYKSVPSHPSAAACASNSSSSSSNAAGARDEQEITDEESKRRTGKVHVLARISFFAHATHTPDE